MQAQTDLLGMISFHPGGSAGLGTSLSPTSLDGPFQASPSDRVFSAHAQIHAGHKSHGTGTGNYWGIHVS